MSTKPKSKKRKSVDSMDKKVTDFSAAQTTVLGALIAGETVVSAAKSGKVSRNSVYRWLKKPAFKSALRDSRDVIRASLRDRLMQTAALAVEAVEKAIADGDAKTSVAILKGLGLLSEDSSNKPANPKESSGWNGHSESNTRMSADYEPVTDQQVDDEIGELLSDPDLRARLLTHPNISKPA